MTDLLSPVDSEVRAHVRERAEATRARRQAVSSIMTGLCWASIAVAAVPLVMILVELFSKGWSYISTSSFYTQLPQAPTLFSQNQLGGISNSLVGSLVLIVYACIAAVPIGIGIGVYLAEHDTKPAAVLRTVTATMIGAPSILMGLFAYSVIVIQFGVGFSILAGSFGLAVLMLPLIASTTELSVRNVPHTLREAGLALGARPSTTSLRIVIPAALTGIVTGCILAISRAVGETAVVYLVIGGTASAITWKPLDFGNSLPSTIYGDVQSSYSSQHDQAWGIALLLVLVIFVLSLAARIWSARKQKVRR